MNDAMTNDDDGQRLDDSTTSTYHGVMMASSRPSRPRMARMLIAHDGAFSRNMVMVVVAVVEMRRGRCQRCERTTGTDERRQRTLRERSLVAVVLEADERARERDRKKQASLSSNDTLDAGGCGGGGGGGEAATED